MKDIVSPGLIKFKGLLFLVVGLFASALVVLEHPAVRTVVLLVVAIWCFCRFYYFAFYVIQHYVDAEYRFTGLWSFARYLMRRRGSGNSVEANNRDDDGGANSRNR